MKELTALALQAMRDAGAEKAQCFASRSEKQEFNVEKNAFALFRSTFNATMSLTALLEGKKASLVLNRLDEASVREAAGMVVDMAKNSQADLANDISAREEGPAEYRAGLESGDRERMFSRVEELLEKTKAEYPSVTIVDGFTDFVKASSFLHNTNGVEIACEDGYYTASFSFGARDGETAASLNGGGGYLRSLDSPLWDCCGLGMLIDQNVQELKARQLKGKFTGDVIVTPFFAGELLSMYMGCYLTDYGLISGTSTFKDRLGQKVASNRVTVTSDPFRAGLVASPVTADGFRAKSMTVLNGGVLESFVLSQYGANKTGRARSGNLGGNACFEPGDLGLDELIAKVDRGIVLGRFSGGRPSDNGDFSGVAKNSFYIENGKIAYPVTETMISGNLRTMLENVSGISRETISSGSDIQPWVLVKDVGISGS